MRIRFIIGFVCFIIFTAQAQVDNAVRMAESIIRHNPSPKTLDGGNTLRWGYTHGLLCKSLIELSDFNGNKEFYKYAASYADSIVNEDGTIKTYKLADYNIDQLNGGKILFQLYNDTHKEKYAKALRMLRSQMRNHPRTADDGFWHKKVYPHQMWLDGLYMGSPFLSQYAKEFNEPALFDDVVHQIMLVNKHHYDPATGLYYHGWDESHEQKWSSAETGQSPNFWGRALGWYAMALVDVMDNLPENHPGRDSVLMVIDRLANGIVKYQDSNTGNWYQVMNMGERSGNYQESSASAMFSYFLLKSLNKGYINPDKYRAPALKAYQGILDNFIQEEQDGTISITKGCAVSGLGGNPYRDGSFEYYISEPIRNNDLKAVGPFILASLELTKLLKSK